MYYSDQGDRGLKMGQSATEEDEEEEEECIIMNLNFCM
jgi:hypothetical protein